MLSRDRTSSNVGNWDFGGIGHCWIDKENKKVLVQTVMRDQKLRGQRVRHANAQAGTEGKRQGSRL